MRKGNKLSKAGRLLASLALFSLPVVAVSCGGGGGSLGMAGSNTEKVVKTGELVVSAKFPSEGEVGSALIDQNTARIRVDVRKVTESGAEQEIGTINLTPSNPTGRLANVPTGPVRVYVRSYDSDNNLLDYLFVTGEIVEGQNNIVATLIRGAWTLVDNNGNPTTIRLNKTLSDDPTTINSFSVIPYSYSYVDFDDFEADYNLLWKGSGFLTGVPNGCQYQDKCLDYLKYRNIFTGPSTNKNYLDSDKLSLRSTSEGHKRGAFIVGTPPGDGGNASFSDPDIQNYFNSRVTGPTTIEGTIFEILTRNQQETLTCYNMQGNQVTCPSGVSSSSLKQGKGIKTAVQKALSQRVGKSAPDSQGCFRNGTATWTDEWIECLGDLDGDNIYCEYPNERIRIVASVTWSGDVCIHPFKARGSQLPTTDLEVVIQRQR